MKENLFLSPSPPRREASAKRPLRSWRQAICTMSADTMSLSWIATTPQFSINEMRKRDAKGLETNSSLQELAIAQFSRLQKPTYSILCTTSDEAIGVVQDYLEQNESETDFVFFDLPGTINTRGVIDTLACMDYIFTPISSDRISLESTLSFSAVIKQAVTDNADTDNKGIYLFWNMVDGREKTTSLCNV